MIGEEFRRGEIEPVYDSNGHDRGLPTVMNGFAIEPITSIFFDRAILMF